MNMRLYLIIGGVALLAAVGIAFFLLDSAYSPPAADAAAVLAVTPDDHTVGDPKAPIKIVEYFAPSCPICARFDADIFPQVKSTYIDTGKVYYVFRVFQLRPADGAAEAIAQCLPKENYFDFIRHLFQNQSEWDPEFGVTDVRGALQRMGRVAGLTSEKVDACMTDQAAMKKINKVTEDAVAHLSISGTPTLYLNGKQLASGSLPWDELKQAIDAELEKIKKQPPQS
jgi:protein-disulfide isomerase